MKNRNLFLTLSLFVLVITLSSLSSAWIVLDTHDWVSKQALAEAPNSPVGQVVAANYEDFSACNSLTDYSVFLYFQQGFSTIGKVYLASHNDNICARAVELADKNNKAELACAYGVCAMSLEDSPSHNGFVPMVIERTGLVNGIVHASAEECVNKKIATPQSISEGRSALVNKYKEHRDFLIKVFQSDSRATTIDVGNMMDAFVAEVASSNQYTVGFRGFTAVPLSIHVVLLLYFLFGMITMAYLIRKKNKSKFNKISMVLLLVFVILPVILVYILFFTGNLWKVFQAINTPVCWVMPISGYKTYLNQAVDNMVNFYNNGASMIYQIQDPSGMQSLSQADSSNVWKLWVIGLVLSGLIILFLYLNFKKRR